MMPIDMVQQVLAREAPLLESLAVKIAVAIIGVVGTGISAAAVWLVTNAAGLNKKWDAFAVTWYGDPSDQSPNGAKHKLYTMADEVSELKLWTSGYDRALGALAKDNENLRGEWQPGDPDRREQPRESSVREQLRGHAREQRKRGP